MKSLSELIDDICHIKCANCSGDLVSLPMLFFHSGRSWYGCEQCNLVYEYDYCSFTGSPRGTRKSHLTLAQYREQIEKNKKEK